MTDTALPTSPPRPSGIDPLYRQTWKPLGLLNLYRLTLAGLLSLVVILRLDLPPFGERDPKLFYCTCVAYLLFTLLCVQTIQARRPSFRIQISVQILVDIIAISLLVYACGGVRSGLGTLLITTLAGAGMLLSGRLAVAYAATAALALLLEEAYGLIYRLQPPADFTHAGLLGASFLITAIVAHALAKRARESEALAAQRGVDLANMQQLTEYVIQRMQTGIIVIDAHERIHLINESAWRLLGSSAQPVTRHLRDCSPELSAQLQNWLQGPDMTIPLFRATVTSPELLPRFAKLGQSAQSGVLIFLEDTAATAQQAQQMKLASLGRLTASIAHEIRNPLGAISYAGQLLAESPHLDDKDLRFTEIIRDHCQRMDSIVENVLQLSRRQRTQPQEFELKPWLNEFVRVFSASQGVDAHCISIHVDPPDTIVRIDPSQLDQILWNLCHNGVRYSEAHVGQPYLELRVGIVPETVNPFLDVIDRGLGMSSDVTQHIFEPFFTTESKGTGLGLYIARELCESNQARLNYIRPPGGGSCFRITFADPRRKQLI